MPLRIPLRACRILPASRTVAFTRTYASGTTTNPSHQRAAQQDREKMDTQPNETAKSGTDAGAAENESAAFDGKGSSDPETARQEAGKGNEVNPLDASPANPELSSGTSETSGGADKKQSEGGGGRRGGGDSTGNKSSGSSV